VSSLVAPSKYNSTFYATKCQSNSLYIIFGTGSGIIATYYPTTTFSCCSGVTTRKVADIDFSIKKFNDKRRRIVEEVVNAKSAPRKDEAEFMRSAKMLLELGKKYNTLEEKVDEINKFVVKKKKKINVLDWLNANIQPSLTFEKLHEKIIIIDEDISYLLNN
jgi:hypothetical protein